jgi:3-dehydro-L-gulonate 2-dehydrogenase
MDRALTLARRQGVGAVALANTTHWMRGGSYGWQAAAAGFIGMCWTNTMPNLPQWGSAEARLGNNPLVFAVPRPRGHVVLDMAMSQFSYGALDSYREQGETLPV